jgi:hypothetical protein
MGPSILVKTRDIIVYVVSSLTTIVHCIYFSTRMVTVSIWAETYKNPSKVKPYYLIILSIYQYKASLF